MNRLLALAAAVSLTASLAPAQQVVLDFEDRTGFAPLPAGYGGVANWGSWAASDLPDANYPAASGVVKALSVGPQQRIQFGQDVIFEGANVVSALPFSWRMYHQGAVVADSVTLQPNTGGPAVWLASGYSGPVDELEYVSPVNVHGVDDFTYTVPQGSIGTSFCTALPNSTGATGTLTATGSTLATDNDVTLTAGDLPVGQFGIFVVSRTFGPEVLTGDGNLCLNGPIGRYTQAGQILQADAMGSFSLALDLTSIPTPTSFVSAQSGDTFCFQAWHRDGTVTTPTANFSEGVQIMFM